jgi:nucleotide-binding universal stress UspA family protein
VSDRHRLLIAVALVLTAVDLGQKASAPVYGHPRGVGYVVVAAALTVLLVLFVPRVPSRPLAVAGGVAAAGAFGNFVSALAWRGGIPNPIVAGDVAFNVADLCAVSGAAALVIGAMLFALRNPALLRQPI